MSVFSLFDNVSYEMPIFGLVDKICSYTVNICLFVYLYRYNDSLYRFYWICGDAPGFGAERCLPDELGLLFATYNKILDTLVITYCYKQTMPSL